MHFLSNFQNENPVVDTLWSELVATYGDKLLPLDRREERKRSFVFVKAEDVWRKRLVRGVTLHETRHRGKDVSRKAASHTRDYILRHHSRVGCQKLSFTTL